MAETARDDLYHLTACAVRVAEGATGSAAAMAALCPVIERLASRVATGSHGRASWIAADFAASSPSLIFEELRKGRYDPKLGPFKAWCHTVLRSRLVSELRRQKPRTLLSLNAPLSAEAEQGYDVGAIGPELLEKLAAQSYSAETFSTDSLSDIEKWPPHHRVLLISLALLWTRVPPQRWLRWCAECQIHEEFPPSGFLDQTPRRCQAIVADAMGITLNHLYVLKRRTVARLLELDPDAPVVSYIRRRLSARGRMSPGGTTSATPSTP